VSTLEWSLLSVGIALIAGYVLGWLACERTWKRSWAGLCLREDKDCFVRAKLAK